MKNLYKALALVPVLMTLSGCIVVPRRPVVYAPHRVYAPAPVVYTPRPVVYAPRPVVVAPRPVIRAGVVIR